MEAASEGAREAAPARCPGRHRRPGIRSQCEIESDAPTASLASWPIDGSRTSPRSSRLTCACDIPRWPAYDPLAESRVSTGISELAADRDPHARQGFRRPVESDVPVVMADRPSPMTGDLRPAHRGLERGPCHPSADSDSADGWGAPAFQAAADFRTNGSPSGPNWPIRPRFGRGWHARRSQARGERPGTA